MRARRPVPNKQRKRLEQEARIVVAEELDKQRDEATRKLLKIIFYVLHVFFGFGYKRCMSVLTKVTELLEESYTNEVFFEDVDRDVIDRIGLPFDRDYSDF
jgi:hypothetical protein